MPPTADVHTLLCIVDITIWDELNLRIIDTAVGQWLTRIHACVKALGGHFEHKL